jgi:hypothetical protein
MYDALLRDAQRDRFTIFDSFLVQALFRTRKANTITVPERIAVTAAIAPEAFRLSFGSCSQGFPSISGLAYHRCTAR